MIFDFDTVEAGVRYINDFWKLIEIPYDYRLDFRQVISVSFQKVIKQKYNECSYLRQPYVP